MDISGRAPHPCLQPDPLFRRSHALPPASNATTGAKVTFTTGGSLLHQPPLAATTPTVFATRPPPAARRPPCHYAGRLCIGHHIGRHGATAATITVTTARAHTAGFAYHEVR